MRPTTTIIKNRNGNYDVEIFSDGTKIREYSEEPLPLFPESMDVKITDYCDAGCGFCHEKSTIEGKHGDLKLLLEKLKDLPAGTEIAIGGGNPLSHPDLVQFLRVLRKQGIIPNMTVNQMHVKDPLLQQLTDQNLIFGLGISGYAPYDYEHTVYHVIAGVTDHLIEKIIQKPNQKILILGYKQWGRGKSFYSPLIEKRIKKLYWRLHTYFNKALISFDNLAIKQLNIKRFFNDESWKKFYMGDDGRFTMYMDAVKQEYSVCSFSEKRFTFKKTTGEMFNNIKNIFVN